MGLFKVNFLNSGKVRRTPKPEKLNYRILN